MVTNAAVIVLIVVSTLIWLNRGFFSAFINLFCVVAAGAIAFALWEPAAYFLLDKAEDRGFVAELLAGNAWALGLATPFVLSLAALRGISDGIIRHNLHFPSIVNNIGGGFCGALAGVIISGLAIMSAGMLHLPKDGGFLEYKPADFDAQGSVKLSESLWVPSDRLTSNFYAFLSRHAFHSDTNLATYYPNAHAVPALLRMIPKGDSGRNTIKPSQFAIEGAYQIDASSITDAKARLVELTRDRYRPAGQGGVVDFKGEPVRPDAKLIAYVVNFNSGAKERNGQVLIGNGQVRLLATDKDGNAHTLFPIAAVGRIPPDTSAPTGAAARNRNAPKFARYPFNTGGNGIHIASVGGESDAKFAFEFLVPSGFTPKALYVKNTRRDVSATVERTFTSAAQRDAALDSIMAGRTAGQLDESIAYVFPGAQNAGNRVADQPPADSGFQMTIALGMSLQKDTLSGITFPEGRNTIADGQTLIDAKTVSAGVNADMALRVSNFAPRAGVVVCQVDISMDKPWRLGEKGLPIDQPVALLDAEGRLYEAIGYVYRDNEFTGVRYTPGSPLKGMADLPQQLSRAVPGQQVKLVFQVTRGAVIRGVVVGDKLAIKYAPFKVDAEQATR
jgi:hypothetical protein